MFIYFPYRDTFKENPDSLYIVTTFDGAPSFTVKDIPQTKEALKIELDKPRKDKILWPRKQLAYEPLRINHWITQNEIYDNDVKDSEIFEPYYVMYRYSAFYDENFNGWGFDKVSHAYTQRTLKRKLKMLPDVFAVHLDHSGLSNYSDWNISYNCEKIRTVMREMQWRVISNGFSGLMVNDYYPPWLKNKTSIMTPPPLSLTQGFCQEEHFIMLFTNVSNKISFMKSALFGLLGFWGVCLLALVSLCRAEKKEENKMVSINKV